MSLPQTPSTRPAERGPAVGDTRLLIDGERVDAALQSGPVWVNCYGVFDAALPFGGTKESGWGREMGHAVLDDYTETKTVCMRVGA